MSKHETTTTDLMKRRASEVKEPTDLPSGDWELRCGSAKYFENEDYDPDEPNSARYIANFMFVPVKPVSNVDEDEVAEGSWRGKPIYHRVYIRGFDDLWELNKIFTGLGIDITDREYDELFPLAKGRTAIVTVGLRTFKRRDGRSGKANTLSDFRQG